MYTKQRYAIKDVLKWTRYEIIIFTVFSGIITCLYHLFNFTFLNIPWTPLAVIGTAVAFLISFQNNAAYGRIWEARKIWGGMVNTSRTFGMKVQDMVTNEYANKKLSDTELQQEKKQLIYRHIAWLTALRYAMRQQKPWEVFRNHRTNKEWDDQLYIPERRQDFSDAISPYLTQEELQYILTKGNKQTALLYLQSKHLRKLKESGHIWEFSFLELESALEELFTHQGKSERIKNFPYPRQYATIGYYFTIIFLFLIPFGIIPEFAEISASMQSEHPNIAPYFIWLAIPFCTIVSWIFNTMERIGRSGENPFEGTANDVPISTISRGIETDLRQMLDENKNDIPKGFEMHADIQM